MGLVLTLVRNALPPCSYLSSNTIRVVQGIRLGRGERAESFGAPARLVVSVYIDDDIPCPFVFIYIVQ